MARTPEWEAASADEPTTVHRSPVAAPVRSSSSDDILRVVLPSEAKAGADVVAAAVPEAKVAVDTTAKAVPSEATDGTSIAASIGGFFYGLKGLYEAITQGETRERVRACYAQVAKAGGIIKSSMSMAEHAGAGMATAAIPGVGLAWSCLEILADVATLVETYVAIDANKECLADAAAGSAEALSYERVSGDLNRRLRNSLIQVSGDLVKITGGILQLATGPFGTIVVLAGVLVKLAGTASTFASKRSSNSGRDGAHTEADQAALSGDAERIEGAKRSLVSADSAAAIQEILAKATTVDESATTLDSKMQALLTGFGIGDDLMGRLFSVAKLPPDNADRRAVLAVAERQVQIFLDAAAYDPRSFGEKIRAGLSAVAAWFRSKLGIESSDPHAEVSDHYVSSAAQFALQPIVGAYFAAPDEWNGSEPSSARLSELIAKEYRSLTKVYVAPAPEAKREKRAKALDLGLHLAVEQETMSKGLSLPLRSIKVANGVLYFDAADLSDKITADVRHAIGGRVLGHLKTAHERHTSADELGDQLTALVAEHLQPVRDQYIAPVRARNDRKAVRERTATIDKTVEGIIRSAAKLVATTFKTTTGAILNGDVGISGGVVTITAAADQPESAATAAVAA